MRPAGKLSCPELLYAHWRVEDGMTDTESTTDSATLSQPGMNWYVLRVASNKEESVREALARVMECGLTDVFRHYHAEGEHYTWWDFRTRGYARNRGRIGIAPGHHRIVAFKPKPASGPHWLVNQMQNQCFAQCRNYLFFRM